MTLWIALVLTVAVLVAVVLALALVRIVLADGCGWRPPPSASPEHDAVRTWPR